MRKTPKKRIKTTERQNIKTTNNKIYNSISMILHTDYNIANKS